MRRASLETIERIVKDVTVSEAEATRDRRLSLTMMNCIWARHTDTETREPVQGEASGKCHPLTLDEKPNIIIDHVKVISCNEDPCVYYSKSYLLYELWQYLLPFAATSACNMNHEMMTRLADWRRRA